MKRLTWLSIAAITVLIWAFVISWMVPDRGNARHIGNTVEWVHGGDTVRLDISKIK